MLLPFKICDVDVILWLTSIPLMRYGFSIRSLGVSAMYCSVTVFVELNEVGIMKVRALKVEGKCGSNFVH